MSNTTYRVLVEKLGGSDATGFIGNEGEVFYDPTGNALRLSDGTTPGGVVLGGGGGQSNSWVRPTDWIEMPTVLETEQKFAGLFAVYDAPENFIALYFEGDYTVDWGDGNVEDFNSGDTAEHSYAWVNVPSSTLTTEGYRQVIVTVTPQVGENLTIMDLSVRHQNLNVNAGTPWLDLAVSMPNADTGGSLRFGYPFGINSSVLYDVERVHIIHSGGMSDFTQCFYNFRSLGSVTIDNSPSADSLNNIFNNCTSLTDVVLSDIASVTDMSNMFYNCTSLNSVPSFDVSSATTLDMSYMFESCYSLNSVSTFDVSSATTLNMSGMFYNCTSLNSVPSFDVSSATTLDMSYMFDSCYSLNSVSTFDVSSATTLNINGMFYNCYSLQIGTIVGTSSNISYQNCALGRDEIVNILNNLATVVGRTISVSGNYGSGDLTASDIQIATDKGWSINY